MRNYPPIAKFDVLCRPSGRIMHVAAASFQGAVRTAKANQFSYPKDREFTARFFRWERGFGETTPDGHPPEDFDWSTWTAQNANP